MKHTIKKVFLLVLSIVMVLTLFIGVLPSLVNTVQAAETTPDLKVGVLSDVHLGYYWDPDLQTPRLYKALKTYKAMGVDAILISGDLNDQGVSNLSLAGQKAYMEEFADVWFSVFPEAKGEEGYVEPILIYGNHDEDLVAAGYWPERFGTYSDVQTWEVNGYQFVGAHNKKENKVTTEVADAVAKTPDKPVFYIQHCPIAYTVGRSMGGYGSSYSLAGRANISDYSNVVAFTGHNHMPLTDERSIWQGDSWNDGQFTAINAASLNYSDADANEGGINGNASATQHGMLMTVTGSEVTIERFSFEGLSVDMNGVTVTSNSSYGAKAQYTNVSELATKAVSGSYVKIGKTWSFDACDVTDRPYTYTAREAAAKTPVFNPGEMTVVESEGENGTRTLTVTVPAATVADPSNGVYRDIIHNYIVEACDPLTGEVEAFATEASEFHIDDDPSRLSDSYTMQLTGLEPGKSYIINAYARETFQKRSEPLSAEITCEGTLTSFRIGDINKDGKVDADDLTLLNKILAGEEAANEMVDVDGNKIVEKADAAALENLLAGKNIVSDEGDLMSGATTPAWDSNTAFTQMQTAVTRGDSNVAYNAYAIAVSSWPDGYIYFEEPQDWSNKNVINFDILFENEYKVGDYTKPTREVRFYAISGANKERSSGYLSRSSFDSNEEGWVSYTLDINTWGNVDWSNVYGLLLDINFDGASNRFDGTTPHGFYLDNVSASLINGRRTDDDILGRVTTVDGGKVVYNAGDTRDSYQAVKSTGSTMTIELAETYKLARFKELYFDNKLSGASSFTVQAADSDGNLLGKAVTVSSFNIWNKVVVNPDEMELDSAADIAKLVFTSTGTLVIDNLSLTAKADPNDLLATATMNSGSSFTLTGDWFKYDPSCFVVNGDESITSWRFISMMAAGWPTALIDFSEDLDLENNWLQFDVKFELHEGKTDGPFFQYYLIDAEGTKLFDYTTYKGGYALNEDGWATVQLDLSTITSDLSKIKTLALRFNFDQHANVYVDNMQCIEIPKADQNDLLTSATLGSNGWGNSWWGPPKLSNVTNPDTEYSTESLFFDALNEDGWPWAHFTFAEVQDFTNKILKFDVKNVNEKTMGRIDFRLFDSAGNTTGEADMVNQPLDVSSKNADGWYTVTVDLSGASNVDMSKIAGIIFRYSAGEYPELYIDNMRLEALPIVDTDLIAQATSLSTSGSTQISISDSITNGSDIALLFNNTEGSGNWNYADLKFSTPIDLSDAEVLKLDAKRTGVYPSGGAERVLRVYLYDSQGGLVYCRMPTVVDCDWSTLVFDLRYTYSNSTYVAVDQAVLSDIATMRIQFYANAGEVTVVDNITYGKRADDDLISAATAWNIDHTVLNYVTDETNGSAEAVMMPYFNNSWPKFELLYAQGLDLSTNSIVTVDVKRTTTSGDVKLAFYNAAGTEIYTQSYVSVGTEWKTLTYDLSELGSDVLKSISKIRIYAAMSAGDALIVDNLKATAPEVKTDSDLIATASSLETHNTSGNTVISISETNTNSTINAMVFDATGIAGGWCEGKLIYENPIDMSGYDVIYLDVKRVGSGKTFRLSLYDSDGNQVYYSAPNVYSCDWTTLVFPLSYTTNGSALTAVNSNDLKDITKIQIQLSTNAGEVTVIDNMVLGTLSDNDLISQVSFFTADNINVGVTKTVTNNSDLAIELKQIGNTWPHTYLKFGAPVDLSKNSIISVDVKRANTSGDFKLIFYTSDGAAVFNPSYTVVQPGDWTAITYDLSGLDASVLKDITQIKILAYVAANDILYVDNICASAPN